MIFVELRSNIELSFSSLTLEKNFTTTYSFFNNNIFSVSNNFNSLLHFLRILTVIITRKDYKDIEIELNITTLY